MAEESRKETMGRLTFLYQKLKESPAKLSTVREIMLQSTSGVNTAQALLGDYRTTMERFYKEAEDQLAKMKSDNPEDFNHYINGKMGVVSVNLHNAIREYEKMEAALHMIIEIQNITLEKAVDIIEQAEKNLKDESLLETKMKYEKEQLENKIKEMDAEKSNIKEIMKQNAALIEKIMDVQNARFAHALDQIVEKLGLRVNTNGTSIPRLQEARRKDIPIFSDEIDESIITEVKEEKKIAPEPPKPPVKRKQKDYIDKTAMLKLINDSTPTMGQHKRLAKAIDLGNAKSLEEATDYMKLTSERIEEMLDDLKSDSYYSVLSEDFQWEGE